MGTFDDTYETMTRTIFIGPGVIVHSLVGPRFQGLHRHEISKHYFTRSAGKPCLQHIASSQVALRAWDCSPCLPNLEVTSLLSIEQTTEDGRAIEIGQTSPVYRPLRRYKHRRVTITN